MKEHLSNYYTFIKNNGISLSEMAPGSNDFALKISDAIEAIKLLKEASVGVLGGDVLTNKTGRLKHTYDNWYSQKNNQESDSMFIDRSHEEALNYISSIASRSDETLFIALVI